MLVKIISLTFDSARGGFDDSPIREFLKDKEVINITEHFFIRNDVPYITLIVKYFPYRQEADPALKPEAKRDESCRIAFLNPSVRRLCPFQSSYFLPAPISHRKLEPKLQLRVASRGNASQQVERWCSLVCSALKPRDNALGGADLLGQLRLGEATSCSGGLDSVSYGCLGPLFFILHPDFRVAEHLIKIGLSHFESTIG